MRYISIRFLFFLMLCIPHDVNAQIEPYVTIHNNLKSYTISSLTEMYEHVHKNYTVHSSKGSGEIHLIIPYDKYSKITDADIQYTYKSGITKKFKLKDFADQVMHDGFSLFSDNRMKILLATVDEYPVTIVYNYSIKYKNTLALHTWMPINDFHTAITHTALSIKSQSPGWVSIKEINFNGKKEEKDGVMIWRMDSIPPIEDEMFSMEDDLTKILLSPTLIDVDGFKGNLKSWKEYGQWVNGLIQDRDILNDIDQDKIRNLIPTGSTTISKIEILYRYLQNNTRYVSIQLGIGGWQPMPATEVSKLGYGDCKALSNYMRALLKAVGIESYYTEIGNGDRKINYSDFASFYQTNHVILTVPLEQDTTFLECTSQFFPPGYIGSSNADRYALMSCPDGGRLIHTPIYNHESNVRTTVTEIKLTADGNGSALIQSDYTGQYFETFSDFSIKSKKEQNDVLMELHDDIDYSVDSFSYNFTFTKMPSFHLEEKLSLTKYASVSGVRLFIPLHIIQRYQPKTPQSSTRRTDIQIASGFSEFDSLSLIVPDGYGIENLPKPFLISNQFGSIESKIEMKNKKIVIVNHFKLFKNLQPRSAYAELSLLLERSFKSTQSKIILKKILP